jgi:putative ABC transport system permease protein
MTTSMLVRRGLQHYWRTNLAVIAGVATAVAVLAGALLVGDSVRGSLRDLVVQRLGRTDRLVAATSFFRDALADDIRRDPMFDADYRDIAPLIVMQGVVADQVTGRRASGVQVYGVDDRFWRFHGIADVAGPADREAYVSRALAADIGAAPGTMAVVRIEKPSAIPLESLHGRKESAGRSIVLTVRRVIDAAQMGDFTIRPQQGDVRAVFVPMRRLQQDLEQPGRANAMVVADRPGASNGPLQLLLKRHAQLADFGLTLRTLDAQQAIALESSAGIIDGPRAAAADRAAAQANLVAKPVFTYLANAIRHGDREVPYSLVSAADSGIALPSTAHPIVLNDWTARELGAKPGDAITLDYYVWEDPGYLETRRAEFTVAGIVPIAGAAADRDLAPVYPGITGTESLSDWDPPFPIDLKRVRPVDEDYWKKYRTTPKAFVTFADGRRLWQTRYGDRTSVRLAPAGQPLDQARARYEAALRSALDPPSMGYTIRAVRDEGLTASRGATDFGEYFVYFSFFLVTSALVLAALFFRLTVEQRAREVGLLRAVGFSTPRVRTLFTAEGLLLAIIGSAIGAVAAVGYGAAMMAGLRTWWSGAVGTTALTLHVSATSLLAGAGGALLAAAACIWWTLRGLSRLSERALLAGQLQSDVLLMARRSGRSMTLSVLAFAALGFGLIGAAAAKAIDPAGAFFGAGAAILIACLCLLTASLRRASSTARRQRLEAQTIRLPQTLWLSPLGGRSRIANLGFRNASIRPGRSVLAVAVIASAVFILISVDAFRLSDADPTDRRGGTGGYPLLVDLLVPIVHDPNSADGRDALGLSAAAGIHVEPFRVRPGEDTSCLNLYEPTTPRILGVSRRFISEGRFSFQGSLASTDAERANPWLLLDRAPSGDAVPIAADSNSLTYVLHKKVGDEIVLAHGGAPLRLHVVAALDDSLFQGELLMSEPNFIRLFPEQQGYRFLLIDAPPQTAAQVSDTIEKTASDLGADAVPTTRRLAEFHAVENTYLSTFQSLGGLGLLVGTIGLAAVLLRNVLERRRELALLRAVGFARSHLFTLVLSENVALLVWGLSTGLVSALIAIAPAALQRGARLPLSAGGGLLVVAVLAGGLLSSVVATRAALRAPLVAALRSE